MASSEKRVYSIQSEYMERYEKQQKHKQRRKRGLRNRLVAVGIVMLAMVVLVTHYHIGQRTVYSEKQQQYEALTAKIEQLKTEEKDLMEEIDLLKDEAYILDIARTNYFLTKEGELIFQMPDSHSSY